LKVPLIFIGAQQQEEQDRKAARLKEMEARRQAVLQKKVEEGKVKAGEEEKKVKGDAERRKKEREENTGKRPLVRADSKVGFEPSTGGQH
jgi:membrane protein involved in colicin uptake